MLGFIHITKTGGTNIKDKNENKNILYGSYHNENASFYKTKNVRCFAILREPIERYVSLFYYNTKGSNKYKVRPDRRNNNINDFVNSHFNDRDLINKYEGGMQFKKQIEWLQNGDNDNIFIVKFDKKNLIQNIRQFCQHNKIPFFYNEQNVLNINVTNYRNVVELTEDSKKKIIEMYKEDYVLYNKFVLLNKPFCKLSDII